jgi:16S rRNA (guanine(966)-N(2))-methyltransferase RsmD
MRIISGTHKGRPLITPHNREIRPTSDRTKQMMFDGLAVPFHYPQVLDLFAGTGSLGLEALSRGSEAAFFVDISNVATALIRENCQRLSLLDKSTIIRADVFRSILRFSKTDARFHLILADPPYLKKYTNELLQIIDQSQLLLPGGILIIEHSTDDIPDNNLVSLKWLKSKKSGETSFSFFYK